MSQVTIGIGPFVPDAYAVFLEILHVRVALQEPEQFVDDGFQMELLRRQTGKTVVQVETHLVAEHAERARARAVFLAYAFVEYALQEVEILFHVWCLSVYWRQKYTFYCCDKR